MKEKYYFTIESALSHTPDVVHLMFDIFQCIRLKFIKGMCLVIVVLTLTEMSRPVVPKVDNYQQSYVWGNVGININPLIIES